MKQTSDNRSTHQTIELINNVNKKTKNIESRYYFRDELKLLTHFEIEDSYQYYLAICHSNKFLS